MTRGLAESYRAELIRATRMGLDFDLVTGEPALWAAAEPVTVAALAWVERASLPLPLLQDPRVTRDALNTLTLRLDGSRAAASTIARKRAAFHNALGYATELGLQPANPLDRVAWKPPRASAAVNPRTVATPGQVRAILAEVATARPQLEAFFGCLYYAALRPEEAVALRQENLRLPATGWGTLILTTATPRTSSAWTNTGRPTSHVASSSAPKAQSGRCPSHQSWPPCSITTSTSTGQHPMGGCSRAPTAAR